MNEQNNEILKNTDPSAHARDDMVQNDKAEIAESPKAPRNGILRRWWFWVLLAIGVLTILFAVAVVLKGKTSPQSRLESAKDDGQFLSGGQCEGETKPKITHLPMKQDDFAYIIPYGQVIDNHVTPIDHQYFQPTDFNSPASTYPVYAMADAKLVSIEKRKGYKGDNDIRLVFSMSCKLFYYFDLVNSLSPEIEKEMSGKDNAVVNIPVKGGQQIGAIGGRTLDFAVWDMDVKLSGFLVPEHYRAEPWKIHTADPLLFYTEELKSKVLPKYIRTAEPASGKIDFDIDGKLIGSWFLEGSSGFGSPEKANIDIDKSHLSIIPDHIDPTSFVFSIGEYDGKPAQFGFLGNGPDPTTIGVESGLIKYELVQLEWIDNEEKIWNRQQFASGLKAVNHDRVLGVALVQMTEARKLKLELFPGKNASKIDGFTANARIYER